MTVSESRVGLKLGVFSLVLLLLLSLIDEEAFARGRRGRGGVRRAGPVRAQGRVRRGGRARVARGGGQGRARAQRVVRNNLAAPAVNNNAGNNGQNNLQDFGPASASPFNQIALGNVGQLQVIPGFNNIALNGQGQVVELNQNAIVNGQIVNANGAIRQNLVSLNGSVFAGSSIQMLPGTALELQQFNQANLPASSAVVLSSPLGQGIGNFGGASQVRSLRSF